MEFNTTSFLITTNIRTAPLPSVQEQTKVTAESADGTLLSVHVAVNRDYHEYQWRSNEL